MKSNLIPLPLHPALRDGVTWRDDEREVIEAYVRENLSAQAVQLSELQKDAAKLLFALRDAWPYVHQSCTIDSVRKRIVELMRKHGDFADPCMKEGTSHEDT